MNKLRRPMIAGNWKMQGSRANIESLLGPIKQNISPTSLPEVVVLPPFIFLEQVERILAGSSVQWGAQNIASENNGAYTGEVSGAMLVEFGCRYVLVGHSERRSLYAEDDKIVAKKFAQAQKFGLVPILCLGETLAQRNNGTTMQVVSAQLAAVLEFGGGVGILNNAIIAYEPIWAIGTGLTATPDQAEEVHAALRSQIATQSESIAERIRILYGGSVKASNAKALLAMPNIDGGLIGGASLDAQEFLQICQIHN